MCKTLELLAENKAVLYLLLRIFLIQELNNCYICVSRYPKSYKMARIYIMGNA